MDKAKDKEVEYNMEELTEKLLEGKWVSCKEVIALLPTRIRVGVRTRHFDVLIDDAWYLLEQDKRGYKCRVVKAVEPRWS